MYALKSTYKMQNILKEVIVIALLLVTTHAFAQDFELIKLRSAYYTT